MREIVRRQFLGLGAAAGGAALLAACSGSSSKSSARPSSTTVATRPLIEGDKAPFDHVVVPMLENRSFDHLLGWLPGADGKQRGLTYTDAAGQSYPVWDLRNDTQGCGYADPPHQWPNGVKQFNGGKIDGFLTEAKPSVRALGDDRRRRDGNHPR